MKLFHRKQTTLLCCPDSQKTFIVKGYVGCRVFLPPPLHPSFSPPSYSSILPSPPGTYLSVAFIHNPRDLNLFPPHRPRLFLSLLFLKNFMLSSLSLFRLLSLHSSALSLSCLSSAFYLFQSTQRFQHPYLQERKKRGGGGRGGRG